MNYNITDVDEKFVEKAIIDVKKRYEKIIEISNAKFNSDLEPNYTPVIKYDPVLDKKREFPFPMAYDIWNLYYHIITENPEVYVYTSLRSIEKMFFYYPPFEDINHTIDRQSFYDTKVGILYRMAELKASLEESISTYFFEHSGMSGVSENCTIKKFNSDRDINYPEEYYSGIVSKLKIKKILKDSSSPYLN